MDRVQGPLTTMERFAAQDEEDVTLARVHEGERSFDVGA
jgi:hypothetical protein